MTDPIRQIAVRAWCGNFCTYPECMQAPGGDCAEIEQDVREEHAALAAAGYIIIKEQTLAEYLAAENYDAIEAAKEDIRSMLAEVEVKQP